MDTLEFELGELVAKKTGDYAFDGTVVAVFRTLAGRARFVVEHDGTHMLHIFSAQNLRRRIPDGTGKPKAP
jgi:hypothetical protein